MQDGTDGTLANRPSPSLVHLFLPAVVVASVASVLFIWSDFVVDLSTNSIQSVLQDRYADKLEGSADAAAGV